MKSKRVLITGGAGGIGLCTAKEFAQAGAHLIITDINAEALKKAEAELQGYGVEVDTYVIDVTKKEQVDDMRDDCIKRFGGIDILINNAGIGHHAELKDTDFDKWHQLMDINFWGPLYHIYAFLPDMIEKERGHIVNVSSGQAFFRLPTWGAYAIIKLAFGAFSELLHFEIAKHEIDVTTVYPYMVNTGFYNDVKSENWASKLSMDLLPYYSLTPDEVGKKVFKAVKAKKRVEDIHPITSAGRYLNMVSPISTIYNTVTTYFMAQSENGSGSNGSNGGFLEQLQNLVKMVTGKGGFRIDEVMAGEHAFEPQFKKPGKRPFYFKATWGPKEMLQFLNPMGNDFFINDLKGVVYVDGLTDGEIEINGRLELKYHDGQKIRYLFDFEHDNVEYSFVGEKVNILPWNLHLSHTTCFGELRNKTTGELVSKSITHFHWDTLPEFVGSFRLAV